MGGHDIRSLKELHGFGLLYIAVAWLAGILINSLLQLAPGALWPATILALIFLFVLRKDKSGQFVMFLLLCTLLGAWRYGSALPMNDSHAVATYPTNIVLSIQGSVASEPQQQASGNKRRMLVAVNSISIGHAGTWHTAHGTIELTTNGLTLEDPYGANYGDSIEATGKLQKPDSYSPPEVQALMSFARVSVRTRDTSLLSWLYQLRAQLAAIITRSLPQPEAAVLVAIVLGLKTPALHPLASIFNVTGTAHLIVPSGYKVTILSGLIARGTQWLQRPLRSRRRKAVLLRQHWSDWVSTGLMLSGITLYTLLSGAGPAAIRAGIMGALLVLAPRLRRTYNIYTALALAALMMSLFDPFVLWDAGFQLSFLGTLGIVLFTPRLQRVLRPMAYLPAGHTIAEMIAVTLAAQIATVPVFASTFHNVSLVAPLANTLTVPLLALMIFLGMCISVAGLCFAPLALLCGWIAWPVLWYVQRILTWCAQLPGASVPVPVFDGLLAWIYYALLAAGYWLLSEVSPSIPKQEAPPRPLIRLPRGTLRLLQVGSALCIILATGLATILPDARTGTTVMMLSLGTAQQPQGIAQLVQMPDHKTILIDGGADASSLAQALDSHLAPWQRTLDAVILTSPRRDHITGLLDVIARYQVGCVIDAGMLHPDTTYALWHRSISEHAIRYIATVQGQTIPIGKASIQALWPTAHLHKGSNEVRDNSLVIRLVTPDLRLLILGEVAQSPYALNSLLEQSDSNYLQADIVQIIEAENKTVLPDVTTIIQMAHPAYVVIAPEVPAQKRKNISANAAALHTLPVPEQGGWQSMETLQVGTVAFHNETGKGITLN